MNLMGTTSTWAAPVCSRHEAGSCDEQVETELWWAARRTLDISLPRNAAPASFDACQPHSLVIKGINHLERLRNERSLQPVILPLQLRMFSRVPVIVSAQQYQADGKPNTPFGRLYIAA